MSPTARTAAIAEGLLVTLILGSTLVIAKFALADFRPLTLVGLRYGLAFVLLLPPLLWRTTAPRWPARLWGRFVAIGVSFYVIGNGAVFVGLQYLPATTTALLLSFVPLLVLGAGAVWLREVPTARQYVGVAVGLVGSALFFAPGLAAGEPLGIAIVLVGLAGNAAYGLLGREVARSRQVDTLALTAVPLAVSAVIVLPVALALEGPPRFSPAGAALVLLLATLNTAGVFALYNHTLRTLTALEMSVIVNLSPLVTALWAWIFLGESLRPVQVAGMLAVIGGVALVQRGGRD